MIVCAAACVYTRINQKKKKKNLNIKIHVYMKLLTDYATEKIIDNK